MYKISKLISDGRPTTAGYTLPDGLGAYYIQEMTFENHQQILQIAEKPGYNCEECLGEPGYYDSEGYKIDETSVIDVYCRKNSKPDATIQRLTDHPVDHVVLESREDLEKKLIQRGVRMHPAYGAYVLKKKLEELAKMQQPHQSLAIG